ncbi:MAG: MerR family transcriptional regulator [Chryseolinea sp.]
MGRYSIKDLEQLSGIKAHTIRIWEKRHQIIVPSRTTTNIRFYSDEDLKKIINVSLLNNNGIKISRIADMSATELNEKVLAISEDQTDASIPIDQLVVAMVDMDEESFEKILNNLILRFGFEGTFTEIVYPFLEKIGLLWQTEQITPAQEHFVSNLIRQKVIVAIDGLPLPPRTSRKVLLFLPESELHELGLLFYHYLTRKTGYRSFYFGQCLPHIDLVQSVAIHTPALMVTCITTTPLVPFPEYVSLLKSDFLNIPILLSGYQVRSNKELITGNLHPFSQPDEFKFLISDDGVGLKPISFV